MYVTAPQVKLFINAGTDDHRMGCSNSSLPQLVLSSKTVNFYWSASFVYSKDMPYPSLI